MNHRGAIYAEDAYAQGKMLDHSGWAGVLPRGITPSDIDASVDNEKTECLLLWEFSREHNVWYDLDTGQLRHYRAHLKTEATMAVLCKHSVPVGQKINTKTDVESFSVMLLEGREFLYSESFPGSRWVSFVLKWFENPERVRRYLLRLISENAVPF